MPEFTNANNSQTNVHFANNFFQVAEYQGRVAYFLMSVEATNPSIAEWVPVIDLKELLFSNMVYGIGLMIYSRPSMQYMSQINRATFGILGSLMFNHATMVFYEWLNSKLSDRPNMLTCIAFLSGRLMMVHLLAFLYHVDTRTIPTLRRSSRFEAMYLDT